MQQGAPTFYTVGPLPEIFFGSLSIPTYYLVISLTCCLCIYWFYKRTEERGLSQKKAMDITLLILGAGFIGARLVHVVFEKLDYYIQFPLEVFSFWQGGFVFYGGAVVSYFCAFLYIRQKKETFWLWHDTMAPILALGYGLGRIACFLVGCCYGKVCALPWAVSLKQVHIGSENITHFLRHPTQLYATSLELLILFYLLWLEKRKPKLGTVFLSWVLLHSTGRTIMEFFRADPRGPNILGLSLSTTLSLILFTVSAITLLKKTVTE